mmetsp:Transcript_16702/g.28401  ORF Transcript_16702/g.28401 Transcript_16702/m.28401 type:complete len:88 (+) Transcript_16702:310-573(+)
MRVIFFAEPVDPDITPKQMADSESLEARWVTLEEFKQLGHLRGNELLEFGSYIEKGGLISPLTTLNEDWEKLSVETNRPLMLVNGQI